MYGCKRCGLCRIGSHSNQNAAFSSLSFHNASRHDKTVKQALIIPSSYIQKRSPEYAFTSHASTPSLGLLLGASTQPAHKPTGELKPHTVGTEFLRHGKSNLEIKIVFYCFA